MLLFYLLKKVNMKNNETIKKDVVKNFCDTILEKVTQFMIQVDFFDKSKKCKSSYSYYLEHIYDVVDEYRK